MSAPRPAPRTSLVQRALAGHAAIGLLACALLYLVCLSGALAVVHDGWDRWERPDLPVVAQLSPTATQAALVAAAGGGRLTSAMVEMPRPEWPHAVLTSDRGAWYLDEEGRLATPHRDGFSAFVVDLHETLTLSATWGRIVVGALGAVLAALVVTGVLAHPRIVRDAFRLRARGGAPIARVDWHNRIGVWTLPFALAVATTGAVFGLGGVATTLIAQAEGQDEAAVTAAVFGAVPAADPAPAPMADVAASLRTLAARAPQVTPSYVILRAPMTRGGDVQILARHPHRLIYGDSYVFGPAGEWRGAAGMAAGAIGQQVAASNYGVHFGDFGGWPVEAAYLAMGLGLCVVTATGTAIWLGKRRRRGFAVERLEAAWAAVVAGMPLALAIAAGAAAAGIAPAPATLFWATFAVVLGAAIGWPRAIGPRLATVAAAAIGATALGHALLLRPDAPWPIAIDLLAAAGGAAVLWRRRSSLVIPARVVPWRAAAFQSRSERLDRSTIQS